jgi:hypothetical protein
MIHRAFYKADLRACYICAAPFEVDREDDTMHCSEDCKLEFIRRDRIQTARAQVSALVKHDENHRAIVGILGRLDALYEDDHLDVREEAGEEGAEIDALERLALVARTVERMQAHVSTELDPRFFEGMAELSNILAGLPTEDEVAPELRLTERAQAVTFEAYYQALSMLKRYAEHHEAHKAEPGTIDAEVAAFIQGRGL